MSAIEKMTFSVRVGDEEILLAPTPRAILAISRRFGGLLNAVQQVRAMDYDAIGFVVNEAGGVRKKDQDKVLEQIAIGGVAPVLEPVVKFLIYVMNGCKAPTPDDEDEESSASEGNG